MSEMIERVARAIWGGEASTAAQWDVLSDDEKREWRLRAGAAIAAMSEPTDEMREAAAIARWECDERQAGRRPYVQARSPRPYSESPGPWRARAKAAAVTAWRAMSAEALK